MHKSLLTEHVRIREGTYLFGLPGTMVLCNLLVPCWSQVHGRNLQLHVDENECRMRSYLYAYANAHEMLMHACNLSGAPNASFISLLLRACAWLCTRGYMQLRQGLYKRVAAGQGPTAAPYG